MELKLKNYSDKSILECYEFMFCQYLSGQMGSDTWAATYIFGEVCAELRKEFLSRKNAEVEHISFAEKVGISKVSKVMDVPENKLREVYEQMLIKAENTLRDMKTK